MSGGLFGEINPIPSPVDDENCLWFDFLVVKGEAPQKYTCDL